MTENIIKMAKEAGFAMAWMSHEEHQCIERLVNLAQAAERDACAKVCESLSLEWEEQPNIAQIELATMLDCALAIRARGEVC